ncbi:MAG: phospholipase D-like domain-containing protein [Methylococcales bacterium]|nr:phospholipase D-like domain-containing protein [Methylococcales bacterium]
MNNWTKAYSEIQDLRQRATAPAWIPYYKEQMTRQEKYPVGVYQTGHNRTCINEIITAINNAQETVMLISFLLADAALEQALLQAAKRGVRVYILTASENKLDKEPREDSEFDQQVLAQHKAMLNQLAGKVLLRSAPHFHAKLVLVDASQSFAQGFLLTANLTSEALTRNQEMAVKLATTEITDAYQYLRWLFWEQSQRELLEKGRLPSVKALQSVKEPMSSRGFVCSQADAQLKVQISQIILNADKQLIIASFGWEAELDLVQQILARIKEGVQVIILARIRPKVMPVLMELAEAGANVFGFRWLHAKAVWSDRQEAVMMSANLETQSFDHSLEFGVYLQLERAQALQSILQSWKKQAPFKLLPRPKLGDLPIGEVTFWQNIKLDKQLINAIQSVVLPDTIATSADNLSAEKPKDIKNSAEIIFAHQLEYQWKVVAPKLNGKKQEIKQTVEKEVERTVPDKKNKGQSKVIKEKVKEQQPYQPPVYSQDGRKVVAIRSENEFAAAHKLIAKNIAQAIVIQE